MVNIRDVAPSTAIISSMVLTLGIKLTKNFSVFFFLAEVDIEARDIRAPGQTTGFIDLTRGRILLRVSEVVSQFLIVLMSCNVSS